VQVDWHIGVAIRSALRLRMRCDIPGIYQSAFISIIPQDSVGVRTGAFACPSPLELIGVHCQSY